MVGKKGLTIFVAFFLVFCMPSVLAYSLANFNVEWNGHTVRTIGTDRALSDSVVSFQASTDMGVCLTGGGDVCEILIEAPDMGLTRQRVDIRSDCALQNEKIVCRTEPFTFKISNTPVELVYVGSIEEGLDLVRSEISMPFIIDDTRPEVVEISTGYCDETTCYIAAGVPSPVTIKFIDEVTAFDYQLVFIQGGTTSTAQVDLCTGMTCEGLITVPCSEGQEVLVKVSPMTSEDALNPPVPHDGTNVVCKAQAPEIIEWDYEADGIAGLAVEAGTITYTAKVRSFIGEIRGFVNVSGLIGENLDIPLAEASCGEEEIDVYECIWQLSDLNSGTHYLEFEFYDSVGNTRVKEQTLNVLDVEINRTEDFLTSQLIETKPSALNRMAVELAAQNSLPYPFYVWYKTIEKSPVDQMGHELQECWYKIPGNDTWDDSYNIIALGVTSGGSPDSVIYVGEEDTDANRMDLNIRADMTDLALADEWQTKCQVAVTIVEDNVVYSEPELENISFTMTFRESPLGTPGEEVVNKIQDAEDEINGGVWKTIRKLEEWRQKADQVCGGFETVIEIRSLAGAIGGVANGLCINGITSPIGVAINQFSSTIESTAGGLLNILWDGNIFTQKPGGVPGVTADTALATGTEVATGGAVKKDGIIKQICRQVNCRDYADSAGDAGMTAAGLSSVTGISSAGFGGYVLGELGEGVGLHDPEASLTGAIFSKCIGGVVYNLQKYGAIECGYLSCLKQQSSYGHSMHVCELGRSYQLCTQVIGEIGELPWINVFKNLMANLNHILQNLPTFIWKWIHLNRCATYQGLAGIPYNKNCFDTYSVTCIIEGALIGQVDGQKNTKQIEMGLRNPEKAERALEICDEALETGRSRGGGFFGSASQYGMQYGAARENARAQDYETGAMNIVNQLDHVVTRHTDNDPPGTYSITPTDPNVFEEGGIQSLGSTGLVYTYVAPIEGRLGITEPGNLVIYNDENKVIDRITVPGSIVDADGNIVGMDNPGYTDMLRQGHAFGYDQYNTYVANRDNLLINQQASIVADINAAQSDLNECNDDACRDRVQNRIDSLNNQLETNLNTQGYSDIIDQYNSCIEDIECASSEELDVLNQALDDLETTNTDEISVRIDAQIDEVMETLPEGEYRDNYIAGLEDMRDDALDGKDVVAAWERQQAFYDGVGTITAYAGKWLMDNGYMDFLKTSEWAEDVPILGDLIDFSDNYFNPDRMAQNLCNDMVYDIENNEEGAIYSLADVGIPTVTGYFGTEFREVINNESEIEYFYVTVAHFSNPAMQVGGVDYMFEIKFEELQECASSCPPEYSLTNSQQYNLTQGQTFSSGDVSRTRLDLLPGKYGKVCVDFNKPYPPTGFGNERYCRTISEDTFNTGSPSPDDAPIAGSSGSADGGWQ